MEGNLEMGQKFFMEIWNGYERSKELEEENKKLKEELEKYKKQYEHSMGFSDFGGYDLDVTNAEGK